jgi:hypothetical protein
MKRSPRNPVNLADAIHRQLSMYALSASAAGVGMSALAQPAEGKIIYTPAHVVIGYGGVPSYNLDLNHQGATDFIISMGSTGSGYQVLGAFANRSRRGDGIEFKGHNNSAAALYRGARIGPKQGFDTCCFAGLVGVSSSSGRVFEGGNWLNVRNRYLGLKFQIKGKTHFGWARMGAFADLHPPRITATLTGYAYETIPNKPIVAGQTKETSENEQPDAATSAAPAPRSATLGSLARGSLGLYIWRRKEVVGSLP